MKTKPLSRKEEQNATIWAICLFALLILIASFSQGAEPVKLQKSIFCKAISKSTSLPCKMHTNSPDSLCKNHKGILYRKEIKK